MKRTKGKAMYKNGKTVNGKTVKGKAMMKKMAGGKNTKGKSKMKGPMMYQDLVKKKFGGRV
tara:strand:- start:1446 stop:1628 length:183 start_codon:yes stop_codon:yes gene_type:complete